MHSTQNESKSVVAERFIKILNGEIYKKWQLMIANLILVIWINYKIDAIILIIGLLIKNLLMLIILIWLKKLNRVIQLLNPKLVISITKLKNIFSKCYTKHWPRGIFVIDSMLKTNSCTYKIKDSNGEKTIGSFYEKNCCWVNYRWLSIQNQIFMLEIKSNYY